MESRWYIPPFRGKSSQPGKNPEIKKNKGKKEIEHQDLQDRVKQLELILKETEIENISNLEYIQSENKKLSLELQEIKEKMAFKITYDAIAEKIEAQKIETSEIKNDLNKIKAELENLTRIEESLYFTLQEKKEKSKEMKEENLRSAKESQLSISHFKILSKELLEKQDSLLLINKLEKTKNSVLAEFNEKVQKKLEKDENHFAFASEFRVMKIQLQTIDKEIAELMVNMLNHSNSIISNTFDYTDTTY
jgi:hypothetical protein